MTTTPMKEDIDRVLEIARRYDVLVFLGPRFFDTPASFDLTSYRCYHRPKSSRYRRGVKERDLTVTSTHGPQGHWADVSKKIVWFDHFNPGEIETHLHEVVHCIMNPPGGIDALSEDVVLMPFERALARQCLSPTAVKRVCVWQENTQIEWADRKTKEFYSALEEVPNYTRRAEWRESLDGLRKMGCLTAGGRVTWKMPRWDRAPAALMERGHFDAL